jgi:hypothetical protein
MEKKTGTRSLETCVGPTRDWTLWRREKISYPSQKSKSSLTKSLFLKEKCKLPKILTTFGFPLHPEINAVSLTTTQLLSFFLSLFLSYFFILKGRGGQHTDLEESTGGPII